MAEAFAPKIDSGRIADFTGASRGQIADKSLGTLFEGIGQAVQGAAKLNEQMTVENIKRDVRTVFDESNEVFMDSSGLPDDIVSARKRMTDLRSAYEQGKLSDVAYYGKLAKEQKRLKSKYVGWEDEVDQVTQSVTGIRPANSLRNAILSELSAQSKEAQDREKAWDKWVNDDDTIEILGVMQPDVYANPNNYTDPAARQQLIAEVNRRKAERASYKARIEAIKGQEEIDDNAKRRLSREFTQSSAILVDSAMDGIASTLKQYGVPEGVDVTSYLQKVTTGEIPLDPQAILSLKAALNAQKVSLQNAISKSAMSVEEGGQYSVAAIMGMDEVNKITEQVLAPLDRVMAMIEAGDLTAANFAATANKMIKERNLQDIYSTDASFTTIENLRSISPELAEKWTDTNAQQVDIAVRSLNVGAVTQDGKPVSQIIEFLSNTDKMSTKEVKAASKNLISDVATILSDPKGDATTFNKVANSLFADQDVFKFLGDKSQIEAFTILTNPSITNRIVASGDKQLLNKYLRWAQTSLTSLDEIKTLSADVKTVEATSKYLTASITPEGTISVNVDSEALDAANLSGLQKWSLRGPIKRTQESVNKLNQLLVGMAPIIKANGIDPQEYLPKLLDTVGVDLNARDRSLLQWFADSVVPTDSEQRGAIKKTTEDWLNENSSNGIPTPFDLEQRGQVTTPNEPVQVAQGTIESRFQEQETLTTGEEVMAKAEQEVSQVIPQEIAQGTIRARGLLDAIGKAEGADYDVVYGYNQNKFGWKPTEMTLSEVASAQRQLAKATGSSAFGKYQIIQKTLKGLVDELGLDPDTTKFTPEVQDMLAMQLLKRRGLDKFLTGKMTRDQFQNSLAKEWASLPTTEGRSFYAGDAIGNKASKAGFDLVASLEQLIQ